MINVGILAKIRRMHLREGMSLREVSRCTGLSRNTIRRWLRQPEMTEPQYPTHKSPSKVDAWGDLLVSWLKTDSHRIKRERRTAKAMYEALRTQGYDGGYGRICAFIRRWRQEQSDSPQRTAYVPLSFALGEAFQFDWSCEYVFVGGLRRRLGVAHIKLCASRAFWLVAYYAQSHEMLFDAHARAFAAFGGVPRRGIYDNMRTAVDKVGLGKNRTVNARFHAMCGHYLFEAEFCNRAAGWEKGIVEKNVQDRRRQLWREAAERRWTSLEELNDWIGSRCKAAWEDMHHPQWPELTIAEVQQDEQMQLMPTPRPFDGYVEQPVRVSATGLIHFHRNRYSVPTEYAHRVISLRIYPAQLVMAADGQEIARVSRSFERYQTLAKLANHCAKKDLAGTTGVCDFGKLANTELELLFREIDVGEVWGVGRRVLARLQEMGIDTVKALRDADPAFIRTQFSVVLERTVRELRGESCLALEELAPAKQQIMNSRSFGQYVYELEDLREAVAHHISKAAEKLRSQASVAGAVQVMIRTNPFSVKEPQYQRAVTVPLPEPSDDTRELASWALRVLERIYQPGYAYQKAGVMLLDLQQRDQQQSDLFCNTERTQRGTAMMEVMDAINARWGSEALKVAIAGSHQATQRWGMRRNYKSPAYTTNGQELPIVLAR